MASREAQLRYYDQIVSGQVSEKPVQVNILPRRHTYRIGLISAHSEAIHRFFTRLQGGFPSDSEPCLWQHSLQASDLDGLPCILHFQEFQRKQTCDPHLWLEVEVNISFDRAEQGQIVYMTEGETGTYLLRCGQGVFEGSLQHRLFGKVWEVMACRGLCIN